MKNKLWIGGGVLLALLAACGGKEAAPAAVTPVLVMQPGTGADARSQAYPGEIRARQESPLSFRVGGSLLRRHVDAGNAVKKGQLLAELDVADYALQVNAAQAQYAAAEADAVRARDDYKRYAALAEQQLVSRSALEGQSTAYKAAQAQANAARANLDAARNQSSYAKLLSPADGVIASRQAEAGQVVAAGQTIYTLAGDGAREVAIALPERVVGSFALGQAVEVELWNQPGKRLPGTVREIAAAADPQARTFAARVSLAPDAAAKVELGQSAKVFATHGERGGLSVPLAAVLAGEQGKARVFVVNPADGTLQARAVEVGQYGATSVPVLSGLKPDEWVVAAGGHLLREGQKVRAVDRRNRPVLAPASSQPQGE